MQCAQVQTAVSTYVNSSEDTKSLLSGLYLYKHLHRAPHKSKQMMVHTILVSGNINPKFKWVHLHLYTISSYYQAVNKEK